MFRSLLYPAVAPDSNKNYFNGTSCSVGCSNPDYPGGVFVCLAAATWRQGPRWAWTTKPDCGLPATLIVAYVVGALTGVGLIAFFIFLIYKRRKFKSKMSPSQKERQRRWIDDDANVESGGSGRAKSILKQRKSLALAFRGVGDSGSADVPPDYGVAVRFASNAVKYEMGAGGSSDSDSVDSFPSTMSRKKRRSKMTIPKTSSMSSSSKSKSDDRSEMLPGGKKRKRLNSLSTVFISPEAFQQPDSHRVLRRLSRDLTPTTFVFTAGAGGKSAGNEIISDGRRKTSAASAAPMMASTPSRARKQAAFESPVSASADADDIFRRNQETFANSPAQFDKSKETFAKGQAAFKADAAFRIGPSTFEANQETFKSGQNTFQERRDVFKQSHHVFGEGQRKFSRGQQILAEGQSKFLRFGAAPTGGGVGSGGGGSGDGRKTSSVDANRKGSDGSRKTSVVTTV